MKPRTKRRPAEAARRAETSANSNPQFALSFVALGSNLGDSAAILRAAMQRLETLSSAPLLRSSLWSSSPVGCPSGSPPFVNAVVGLHPKAGETPESLFLKLQALEREFGRGPKEILNEPRLLDLDLISWGNTVHPAPTLTLPHPRTHLRRFVLQPLSEIAPGFILPGLTQTVLELLRGLESDEVLQRLPE